MLDSLVRVSRRVGWTPDRFATDHRAPTRTPPTAHSRLAATAQRAVSAGRDVHARARATSGRPVLGLPTARDSGAITPDRRQRGRGGIPSPGSSDRRGNRSWRSARKKCTRRTDETAARQAWTANGPHRVTPQLPADELNSPGRLCGSTRFPLSGFTYS